MSTNISSFHLKKLLALILTFSRIGLGTEVDNFPPKWK